MVKKAAKAKKSSGKSPKKNEVKGPGPVDLPEVRERIRRLIADKAEKMTTANADEASKGHLAQLKFLFEVLGLYPATAMPEPEEVEGNDLARVLLNRLEFPFRGPADEERVDAPDETPVAVPAAVVDDSVE